MNAAVNTRLFKFVKTIQCRYFQHGRFEGLLKPRSDRNVFVVRRGNTTKIDRTEMHNLMRAGRGSKNKNSKMSLRDSLDGTSPTDPFSLFLLSIPVGTFFLGLWQIQRRQWKLALINDLQERVNSPPANLPADLSELEAMEYHPVKVSGRFLHDREFLIGPKSLIIKGAGASEGGGGIVSAGRSASGHYVITPFKVEGRNLTILVNRGWVPMEYKNKRQSKPQSNDLVAITGIVRLNEQRPPFIPKNSPENGQWHFRDLVSMSQTAGTDPVYIELIAGKTVPGDPIAGQTRVTLRNEHMSYIVTWFSLSAITGWMWHRLCIRKLPLL